ncbi:MAG: hypothetical protein LBP59_03495 [Planctomycetaceae bacterium]|nr:hypothetical protein [Planctomycetaceae bacterium]
MQFLTFSSPLILFVLKIYLCKRKACRLIIRQAKVNAISILNQFKIQVQSVFF